jgi:hypothetical protein
MRTGARDMSNPLAIDYATLPDAALVARAQRGER